MLKKNEVLPLICLKRALPLSLKNVTVFETVTQAPV